MFWIREIAGWLLTIAGGYFILLGLGLVGGRQIIEGTVYSFIGLFVFRGGIHLIKVATAAHVVINAERRRREVENVKAGRLTK